MSKKVFKGTTLFLLATLMVIYNNCGSPFRSPTALYFKSNIYGGAAEVSYDAFSKTVYPITRTNCVSCHATQQPAHASPDLKTAHDAVISNFKVNFSDIPSSRMVKKLREDNHNCWGNCEDNALEMEAAISDWNDAIKASGTISTDPAPVDTNTYTAQSKFMIEEFTFSENGIKLNVVNLNGEAAMLNPPMVRSTTVMDGSYFSVPNNLNTTIPSDSPTAGLASLNFVIRQSSSNYKIWGLVNAPNLDDNGFYTNIITRKSGVKTWEIPVTNGWEWRQLENNIFSLPVGNHTLQIRERKDGTKIKQVVITSDDTFNGANAAELTGITLSYDLSVQLKIPGIIFKIDVIDFDPYSYKFQNPRLITSSANIKIKNIKLLVNNSYNPQHSTYTLIDKAVTPTDAKLSDFAMLVIKDKGLNGDKISFSFEELKIDSGTIPDTGLAASQESFRINVYPVSRTNCINCHTSQNPAHAHNDYKQAHDIVVTQNVVNFTTIASSKLVTKVKGRHNCGTQTQCDAIASQFEVAITEWKKSRP